MTIKEMMRERYERARALEAEAGESIKQADALKAQAEAAMRRTDAMRRDIATSRIEAAALNAMDKAIATGGMQTAVVRLAFDGSTEEPCAIVSVTKARIRALTLRGEVEFEREERGYNSAGEARGKHRGTYKIDVGAALAAWEGKS